MTNPAFLVKGLPSPALACAAYAAGAVFAPSPWRWVLLWPAIVYLLITYCYAIDGSAGAQLLRKRAATDGSLPLPCLLFFLPFPPRSYLPPSALAASSSPWPGAPET